MDGCIEKNQAGNFHKIHSRNHNRMRT